MNQTHPIHVTTMLSREKYSSFFGLVDPARHVFYGLKDLGVDVTFTPNSVREDAKNLIFGLYTDARFEDVAYAVFNLEQLDHGKGGFNGTAGYVDMLRKRDVVDYAEENVSVYRLKQDAGRVPIFPFLHGPHLGASDLPFEERPIDLLFFGSMNDRRLDFIDRLLDQGVNILIPSRPVYGPERDDLIRKSKAVLNYSYYGLNRFEQVRASLVMSLGTPLVSERQQAPAHYEDKVHWIDDENVETFFKEEFLKPSFFEKSRQMIADFSRLDSTAHYEMLVDFLMSLQPGKE